MDIIGQMRERVILQSPTNTLDEIGASTVTLTPLATVWARVTPVDLKERDESGRQAAFGAYQVVIRYRNDIAYTLQVTWRGRLMNISEVKNTDERRQFITLLCRDALPNTGTVMAATGTSIILLEDGVSRILLEDGVSFLLLEA